VPSKHFHNYFIGKYYWECKDLSEKVRISERNWLNINKLLPNTDAVVAFEEIRTILGIGDKTAYMLGDDISENLYRTCVGAPLRLGYSLKNYREDSVVIKKVIDLCDTYIRSYSKQGIGSSQIYYW
jgi:hypothetical protein